MTLLYRVEHHSTGLGPWQHYCSTKDSRLESLVNYFGDNLETFPGPKEDSAKNFRDRNRLKEFLEDKKDMFVKNNTPDRFSFSSLKDLRSWFHDGYLKTLHETGFNLVVYQIEKGSEVIHLNRQSIILDINKAKIHVKQNLISLIRV